MGTAGPQLLNGGGAGRAGMRVPIVGPFFGVPSFDAAVAPLASFVSSFFPPSSHGCSPKSSFPPPKPEQLPEQAKRMVMESATT